MILEIKSGFSSLQLYDDYLTIIPSGIQKSGAYKTIPLDAIISVNIVKQFLKTAYLQVVTPDMTPHKNDATRGADANVVLIMPGNMQKAEYVRNYVAQYKASGRHPVATANTTPNAASEIDALKQLADLKAQGIITSEEFELKKKQLLHL